jgi:3-oxoacyl-[acyl-carrier protein] reductase
MELGITGKVAVVTGGARGIGKAVAQSLAREGCKIAIFDIYEEGLTATENELREASVTAVALRTDVSDPASVRQSFVKTNEMLGPVEILVNSAAVLTNVGKIEQMAQEMWQRDLDVNLGGVFNCVRGALPSMQQQNWGRIVSISSVAGVFGGFGQAGYSSSKAGVIGLMKTVALEQARYNITANAVFPGIIGTEMFGFMRDEMKERIRKRTVFKREGEPADVADAITFLCSERAKYITGAALDISGGISLFTF